MGWTYGWRMRVSRWECNECALKRSGMFAFATRIAGGTHRASAALAGDHSVADLLACNTKALLLQVGDGTLLHGIEPIAQRAMAIGRVGELVTHVIVDLFHRRSPLEVDIDVLGRGAEDLVDHLIAKEGLGTVHGGRA